MGRNAVLRLDERNKSWNWEVFMDWVWYVAIRCLRESQRKKKWNDYAIWGSKSVWFSTSWKRKVIQAILHYFNYQDIE